MKRIILIYLLFSVSFICGFSQDKDVWTLDKCIEYAIEHNITVKRQELALETKAIDMSDSRWAFSPEIYASGSSSVSTGRVLDQTTYEFIKNSTVASSSTSLSGSMGLFNGFRKIYALQRAKLDFQSGIADLEALKNDIRKSVAASFLAVQCCETDLSSAIETKILIDSQVERIAILVEIGRVTESDLLQARAQALAADNDVATAEGNLEMAKLELCQLLELEDSPSFSISEDEPVMLLPDSLSVENGIKSRPEFRVAELAAKIAKKDLSIAQASYYPSLSLSAGYGSSSSSARQKAIENPDGTLRYEAYPFFEQYVDNTSSYISLGLNIPIFNGMSARHDVKKARIAVKDSEYRLKEEEKKLTKEFHQLYVDCKTNYKKYLSAAQQLQYAKEAERQIREKYELGASDFYTWNTAAAELAKAKYSLSEAKCSYIFAVRVLEMF